CATSDDPRCSTATGTSVGGGGDGASLYYVTPGGRSFDQAPEPVARGAAFTVRLVVRAGGATIPAGLDVSSFHVESTPAADWEVVEQGGGQWVNLVPRALLAA